MKVTGVVRELSHYAGIALCLGAIVSFLYDWDPTRIHYKRLKADSPYVYDQIRPEHRAVDPSTFITVTGPDDLVNMRLALLNLVWGPDERPETIVPSNIRRDVNREDMSHLDCDKLQISPYTPTETLLRLDCQLDLYRDLESLAGIDEIKTSIGPVYRPSTAVFRPKQPNGTLIVYQNGYATTYHHQYHHIRRWVDQGFTVAANRHAGYGDNLCYVGTESEPWCEVGWGTSTVDRPLRIHFSPIAAAINHVSAEARIDHVVLVGFSAGSWITMVMAAMDERVDATYAIAGLMPRYMQEEEEIAPNQIYPPYVEIGSLLDQFILGTDHLSRRQVHIFNQYDRCCYRNRRGELYEGAVQQTLEQLDGGQFDVWIDETHPRHKISHWTFDTIVSDIATHRQRGP